MVQLFQHHFCHHRLFSCSFHFNIKCPSSNISCIKFNNSPLSSKPGTSLLNYHKIPVVFLIIMFLSYQAVHWYCYINLSRICHINLLSSSCLLFLLLMQLVNGAKSLNITFILVALFGRHLTAVFTSFIFSLAIIYMYHITTKL